MYAFRYWGCELLCLVNIVLQLWMMDSFFNGEFFTYGTRFGASGSIQTHDSLCILPLNIVNEKTYIFLWFWYIILAIILALLIVY
ncbi:Innexin, partial [Operophtera brumata]